MFRIFLFGLMAIGACVATVQLEKTFDVPEKYLDYSPPYPDGILEEILIAESTKAKKNLFLVSGLAGAAISVLLALGVAFVAGRGKLLALITGLLLGGLIGGAGGIVSRVAFEFGTDVEIDPFVHSILIHAGVYVSWGLALACCLKISLRQVVSGPTVTSIIVASIFAAAIYPFLAAIVFPLQQSDIAPPYGKINQAVWTAVPVIFFIAILARSLQRAKHLETASEPGEDAVADEPAGQ